MHFHTFPDPNQLYDHDPGDVTKSELTRICDFAKLLGVKRRSPLRSGKGRNGHGSEVQTRLDAIARVKSYLIGDRWELLRVRFMFQIEIFASLPDPLGHLPAWWFLFFFFA